MARLVIVSNRVPNITDPSRPAAGGLAVTLADALVPGSLWFGWSGRRGTSTEARIQEAGGITYATIDISESAYRAFYLGFSNSTLWPMFHMLTSFVNFESADYDAYREVNKAFADALIPLLKPDDLIWIHDYQLMSVAKELRLAGVTNRIGFFLHIPFPSPALLEILPPAAALLSDLLAHDVIGFQTEQDRAHFLDSTGKFFGRADWGEKQGPSMTDLDKRTIVTPVGIDVSSFNRAASRGSQRVDAKRVVESMVGRSLMVSVDRLDYTKGLPTRFDAFARFLSRHPEQKRKISFLQIAAPSREEVDSYRALREELDHRTGAINGTYSDFDWVPLRYMARTVSRPLIAGLYRISRIGLVTPLRDGMNLVAMEYIAAQPQSDPGVLILSKFAGAATILPEALIVNPYDVDAVAEAINTALIMSLEERQARHTALLARVNICSAKAYSDGFTAVLARGS